MNQGPKRILITGADGYIGSHLVEYFQKKNLEVHGLVLDALERENFHQADITSSEAVLDIIAKVNPNIVIHSAGLSSLAQCEKDKETAEKINVQGTKNIVDSIKQVNTETKLVFFSSDYVFEGTSGNYKENDERSPKTVYGQNKKDAEDYVQSNVKNYIICRTANVYGKGGNFFKFLTETLQEDKEVEVFDDVFYTPTYIDYLIDSLDQLMEKDYMGVMHIVGPERVSRYQFALKMAEAMGKDPRSIKAVHQPEGGLIAADSSLDSGLLRGILNNFYPSLEKTIHYCVGNLISPYFYFQDERGKLIGILQGKKMEEMNYLESVKGCTRGGHYHKSTDENFFIIQGKIKVILSNIDDKSKKEFFIEGGDILAIPPNVLHTFEVLEESKWVNMLSKAMDNNNKDIFKLE